MNVKRELDKLGIVPDLEMDQYFLENEKILRKTVEMADVNVSDTILEIGAGVGNLTRKLAQKAGKVIAVEADERFKPLLNKLPGNVEIIYQDAHVYASQGGKFRKKKEFNKVVSNIPYNLAEWLMHNLPFVEYDKFILMIPKKFLWKIEKNPVFSSFYKIGETFEVDKSNFYPQPKTDSVLVDILKLEDPLKSRDLGLFLRQFIYQREEWKTKNSLREGLVTYARLVYKKQLTKKEAKKMIKKSGIPAELLEKTAHQNLIYEKITGSFDEKQLERRIN